MANSNGTKSVKLAIKAVSLVEVYKKISGVSIGRFIEDAIAEKIERLPADVKVKMGMRFTK